MQLIASIWQTRLIRCRFSPHYHLKNNKMAAAKSKITARISIRRMLDVGNMKLIEGMAIIGKNCTSAYK